MVAARRRQQERFKARPKITCNARIGSREFKQYCILDLPALELVKFAMADRNLNARACDRALKIARTILEEIQSARGESSLRPFCFQGITFAR